VIKYAGFKIKFYKESRKPGKENIRKIKIYTITAFPLLGKGDFG
jgi:hypothetical protein